MSKVIVKDFEFNYEDFLGKGQYGNVYKGNKLYKGI